MPRLDLRDSTYGHFRQVPVMVGFTADVPAARKAAGRDRARVTSGLPRWPMYVPDAHQTVRLGETMAPMPVADPTRQAFHERRLQP